MTERSNQPVANLAASENEVDDEAPSENRAIANVISTRNPSELLDLPAELRLMIFRHLLVYPYVLAFGRRPLGPQPSLDILRTNRLIHREAFDVLYRENRFYDYWSSPDYSLAEFPRIIDTLQNIHIDVLLCFQHLPFLTFSKCLEVFGNPRITRGTLTVDFQFVIADRHYWVNPPNSWVRVLGRFVNFRTIELQCSHVGAGTKDMDPTRKQTYHVLVLENFKHALEPVLGFGEDCIREGTHVLRFHPIDHRNRLRQPDHGNRAGSLDGTRQEWIDDVTNADNSNTTGLV